MLAVMPNTDLSTMTYVEVSEPGEPEVMHLARGPAPTPGDGEVLVRVVAAGVNRPDVLQRQGLYPPPPGASAVLGLEVAGEVVALGTNATRWQLGERVCALTNGGGYAELCTVPEGQCLPWPDHFDAVRAAALPETYFTVWANLMLHGRFKQGESVLVHGGTSGIGVTAIALVRAFGGRAFATAGTREKCEACVRLGAEAAIDYRTEDFATRIAAMTHGRGVDVVLDIVGAPYFEQNLKCLAMDGRLVLIGLQGGAVAESVDLFAIMRRRLNITGSTMRARSRDEKAALARQLQAQVWPRLSAGEAGPVIHATFPLADVAQAHALLERSEHIGKLVLQVTA